MEALALVTALIVVSIITVAIALRRGGTRDHAEPGVVRRAFHFWAVPSRCRSRFTLLPFCSLSSLFTSRADAIS